MSSPWTPGQDRALNITCKITSILGMAGSISIVVLYARTIKPQRTIRHTILALLSGCLLLCTFAQFMGTWTFGSDSLCAFQGVLIQYSIGNVLWVVHLMTHMVLSVQFGFLSYKLRYFPFFATVISFGFPTIIGSYYAINGMVAPSGPWCTVSVRYPKQRQFLLMFVWICIVYLAVISGVFIFGLYRHSQYFRRHHIPVETSLDKRMIAQVFSFVLILCVNWIPPTAHRIYNLRYPTKPSFALAYASALITPLEGFCNFLVYVFPTLYRKFMATGRLNRFILNLNNVLPTLFAPTGTDSGRSSTSNQAAMLQISLAIETLTEPPQETLQDQTVPKKGNVRSAAIGRKFHEESSRKSKQEGHMEAQRMGGIPENSGENLRAPNENPDMIMNEISNSTNENAVNTITNANTNVDRHPHDFETENVLASSEFHEIGEEPDSENSLRSENIQVSVDGSSESATLQRGYVGA